MNVTLAVLGILAVPLVVALTYLTTTGGNALTTWLTEKGKTSVVAREALVLEDLALAIVTDIEQNEKAALEARSPGVPLTAADYTQLKALAMTRLKAVLQAKGIGTLEAMLGAITTNPTQLDTVLSGKVEQAVAKVSAGAVPAAGALSSAAVALAGAARPR